SGLPQFRNLQPVWYWLVFFAGILVFFDVAARRIAVQPDEVAAVSRRVWQRLRGRGAPGSETAPFIDRLPSRKSKVTETLDQLRAAKRFEPGDLAATAPSGAREEIAVVTAPPARTTAQHRLAPQKEESPADYASRLLKAKQRVWEEREKEK